MNLFRKSSTSKPEQKTIMLFNRELVNKLIEEEAVVLNTTPSAIIESCILDTLLPDSELFQNQLNYIYTNQITMKEGLINIFSTLGIKEDGKFYSIEILSLVNYTAELVTSAAPCFNNNSLFTGSYDPSYLIHQLDSILEHLENQMEDSLKHYIPSAFIKSQLKQLSKSNCNSLVFIFDLIIDYWPYLYQLHATYRALMETCKLADDNIFETANLHKLRKILISIDQHTNTITAKLRRN